MSDEEKQQRDREVNGDGREIRSPRKKFYRKKPNKGTQSSTYKGEIEAIKEHTFVWSQLKTKKWITSREKFIEYASAKYGGDEETSLEKKSLTIVSIKKPIKPKKEITDKWDEFDKDEYKQDLKDYKAAERLAMKNLSKIYRQLWGQCDPQMKDKIAGHTDYPDTHDKKCAMGLLGIIEDLCQGGGDSRCWRLQRFMANKKLHTFRQTEEMSLSDYLKQFKTLVQIAEKTGLTFDDEQMCEDALKETKIRTAKGKSWSVILADDRKEIRKEARERYLAMIFFMNASESKYAAYKQECHNAYSKGRDEYPRTVGEAHTAMEDYRFNPKIYQAKNNDKKQVTHHHFAQAGRGGDNNKGRGPYQCYRCGRWNKCISTNCKETHREDGTAIDNEKPDSGSGTEQGESHLMNEVEEYDEDYEEPKYTGKGFQFNMVGSTDIIVEDLKGQRKHAFNQGDGRVDPLWILLDSCSTVDIFCNEHLIENIREVKQELHLYTNAGKAIIRQKGDLPGYGPVWYHMNGIANVLSLHRVSKKDGYKVEYNSNEGNIFRVTNPRGKVRSFRPSCKGLYYWNSREALQENTNNGTMLLETIEENKQNYSTRDVNRAEKARKLQHVIGHVSAKDLLRIAKNNLLLNCPVTARDVRLMQAILGPSIPGLKGKTTRQRKPEVQATLTPVPRHIKRFYKEVTLCMDIMKVNGIPFVTTISKHIHYGTATPVAKMEMNEVADVIYNLNKFYRKREFKINTIMADGQFKSLETDLAEKHITLNTVSRDEHVPEIERFHRVIKERGRCAYHNTPFTKLPKGLVIGLIKNTMTYLNGVPWKHGVSSTQSPLQIVTGLKLDYLRHCQIEFGTYAQVREETDNTLKQRTVGAIAMGPNHNLQGGTEFFSLKSGRRLDRNPTDYKLLPMPTDALKRVTDMAKNTTPGITFEGRYMEDEDSDAEDEENPEENGYTADNDLDEVSDEDIDEEESIASSEPQENIEEEPEVGNNNEEYPEHEIVFETDDEESNSERSTTPDGNEENIGNTGVDNESDQEDDDRERSSYGRVLKSTREDDFVYMQQTINALILTQYNLRDGLKRFGKDGQKATIKELTQMLKRTVFEEIEYDSLTAEDIRNALPILLFLTEKRNGDVKGRACADGRKQRIWIPKTEAASPTPATEALFYVILINATEERDVATCDLPGHFLQTSMEGRVILKLSGELADMLVALDPDRWGKHRRIVRGRPVIYVRCSKAIYGTVNAAILSYRKLAGHLKDWGFEMNPYEPCCWNQMIDGQQMTIIFHVDDMMLSHKDPDVVTKYLKKLNGVYGTIDPMTSTRGKIHEYLGMTIDYSVKGEAKITMYDYIKKMLNELPEKMKGEKATAAPLHLFKIDDDGPKLDKEDKELFHHVTAKCLYLGKRARPDLQTATSFGCTRVKDPDVHDMKKLIHKVKYIRATAWMPLILRSDGKGTRIYIDGAHAVHKDMKGHAGVMVTEGQGAIYASSTKNKLNTTSSTETEIVSVGEKLPKHIWYRYFRIAQGEADHPDRLIAKKHKNGGDILYQDNESAMLLETNGRMSAGKGSKHIHIRYFFVTDRVTKGEITVEHCPTENMIADYFTKPLQGKLFNKFRNLILGINEEDFGTYKQQYQMALEKYGLTNEQESP